MNKILIILFLLPIFIYSQSIEKIEDMTLNKPKDQATYNPTTKKFELSPELVKYFTDLEDQYKLMIKLTSMYNIQTLNYTNLIKLKDEEIGYLNSKISDKDKIISIQENKMLTLERDLTFYKTGFSITLSIDFISIVGGISFIGGYYLSKTL